VDKKAPTQEIRLLPVPKIDIDDEGGTSLSLSRENEKLILRRALLRLTILTTTRRTRYNHLLQLLIHKKDRLFSARAEDDNGNSLQPSFNVRK